MNEQELQQAIASEIDKANTLRQEIAQINQEHDYWRQVRVTVAASVLPFALQQEPVINAQFRSADDRAIERSVGIADKFVQRLKGGSNEH